jgi:hypothetical protein
MNQLWDSAPLFFKGLGCLLLLRVMGMVMGVDIDIPIIDPLLRSMWDLVVFSREVLLSMMRGLK